MFFIFFIFWSMRYFHYFYQRMARPQPLCTLGGPRINQTQITDTSGHYFHLWTICSRFCDKYEARGTYSENGQWWVNLICFNFWCKTEHCTAMIHIWWKANCLQSFRACVCFVGLNEGFVWDRLPRHRNTVLQRIQKIQTFQLISLFHCQISLLTSMVFQKDRT